MDANQVEMITKAAQIMNSKIHRQGLKAAIEAVAAELEITVDEARETIREAAKWGRGQLI